MAFYLCALCAKTTTVFIIGDSTAANKDISGEKKERGWGMALQCFFDDNILVDNHAVNGRSSLSFLNEGRWDKVLQKMQPGDYVIIQFGHNDAGKELDSGKARNDIMGTADSSHVYRVRTDKEVRNEVVYTFGWYLRKMIDDVREKGGTPILVSLTPRNEWTNGKIERRNDSFGRWYRDVADVTGVEFVDLHNITADALDAIGQEAAQAYYKKDHTHNSKAGARLNAQGIAKGLRATGCPLARYLRNETATQ